MVNLRSHVTGTYRGRKVDFYVTHGNVHVMDAAAAAYKGLTGKNLRLRRRDFSVSHAKGKPVTLQLRDGDRWGWQTLQITVIGRDAE
ncbi:hypothetical protein [Rhizobium phage RHph_X2_26]|nr:hypothetical protein [Rhizobium phage RHph_X2_26]